MSANDRAATSTHLGRGDNWSIPSGAADCLQKKWATAVECHYKNGLALCGSQFPKIVDMDKAINKEFSGSTSSIPKVFLEALTFEDSFIDRMNNTFKS
jgi:hypothetical protein